MQSLCVSTTIGISVLSTAKVIRSHLLSSNPIQMSIKQIDFGANRTIIVSGAYFLIHINGKSSSEVSAIDTNNGIFKFRRRSKRMKRNLSKKNESVVNSVYTLIPFYFLISSSSVRFRKIIPIFDFTLRLVTFVPSFAPHKHRHTKYNLIFFVHWRPWSVDDENWDSPMVCHWIWPVASRITCG